MVRKIVKKIYIIFINKILNFKMEIDMKFVTHSLSETDAAAQRILDHFKDRIEKNKIVALNGDLGSGKTTFCGFFVKHLGSTTPVSSPTFSLVNHYTATSNENKLHIFHFDMYRIKTEDDLYSIGFFDYLPDFSNDRINNNNILIIEWIENILDFLPTEIIPKIINVNFSYVDEGAREIKIN